MSVTVSRPRILIVEDEAIVARDIEHQLVELGYQVAGHSTRAEHAIELVGELRPDLVLMDIQLAGAMDGISAAHVIRTQFALPVVFLTAFAADDVLARAKLTEPYGYVLKPFTERELRTVLEMALYKHHAEATLRVSRSQLMALSRRVLEVQEAERRRVAIELHDELGQSLTAIKINLQSSERFKNQSPRELNAENIRIVEDALQQVRRLALALRPSLLDDLGLVPALQWIADQTAGREGFEVNVRADSTQPRLAPEIETACFRIAQETLTNIARHALATKVEVDLDHAGATLVLCLTDDGVGFDVPAMQLRAQAGGSIGLLGMQERAMLIGGTLDIESSPGQGTTLRLVAPWRSREVPA